MMSSVTHPSLDPVTIEYKGPALRGWNPNSSTLAAVIKAIHEEFNAQPPMPKQQSMTQNIATSVMQNMSIAAGQMGAP